MARGDRDASALAGATIGCAIYTRKSSEEGLDQAFNSLDAQREACEAYITSQKQAGWRVLPLFYHDGGISGGTLERPALQRLLANISKGEIDIVVVYKVDRLTRSLTDFAKIVETFDQADVSFVSVTQQFNTTSSMGRLTLNMLLSFAQFEREVTRERIRDKIAASKKKGMWMAGLPPLGYDCHDRRLLVNEEEAKTVRHIFERYKSLGTVRSLKAELDRDGIISKRRTDRYGRSKGGRPFARGPLYHLLQNELYRGNIVHKGTVYPGQHVAIVPDEPWESVQCILKANRVARKAGNGRSTPSLLASRLFDDKGRPMSPSYTGKAHRRYRYYVSHNLVRGNTGQGVNKGWRLAAGEIEHIIETRLTAFLNDGQAIDDAIHPLMSEASERGWIIKMAREFANGWFDKTSDEKRQTLQLIVDRIDLISGGILITIKRSALLQAVAVSAEDDVAVPEGVDGATIEPTVPIQLQRTGQGTKLLLPGNNHSVDRQAEPAMLRLLAQAHNYRTLLPENQGNTIRQLANEVGVSSSYFSRIARLGFLAPSITQDLLQGCYPTDLTAKQLSLEIKLPTCWQAQQKALKLD